MIIPSSQIAAELAELGCQSIQPSRDDSVFCPSESWVDEFAAWFLTEPTAKPVLGKRDCEDMAIKFLNFASDALVRADSIPVGIGHSIGLATVIIPAWVESTGEENPGLNGIARGTTNGVHMPIIVRCSNNQWYFLEPTNAKKTLVREAIKIGAVSILAWSWN